MSLNYSQWRALQSKEAPLYGLEIINFLYGHKHMLFAVKLVNSMNTNTETAMQNSFSCAICIRIQQGICIREKLVHAKLRDNKYDKESRFPIQMYFLCIYENSIEAANAILGLPFVHLSGMHTTKNVCVSRI